MKRTSIWAQIAAVAVLAGGCGSSGNRGDGGVTADGNFPSGTGTLTWKDNGTMHAALFATGSRVVTATLDYLQVAGGESAGMTGLSFGVATPPMLAPGPFACSEAGMNGRIVSFAYETGGSNSSVPTACTVDLTMLGESSGTRAKGSFSAVVTLDDGSARTITDGVFDVALVVSAL